MKVEVYLEDADVTPMFIANFEAVPRVGETVSVDADGYFTYYDIIEVWYRGTLHGGTFVSCIRVRLND